MTASWKAASTATSGATTVQLVAPAGLQAGDLMLFLVSNAGNFNPTPPAGLTRLTPDGNGTSHLFWKIATAPDAGATFTFTIGSPFQQAAALTVYSRANQAAPIAAFASSALSTTAVAQSASVTTTEPSQAVVEFGTFRTTAAITPTATLPATERAKVATLNILVGSSDQVQATQGPSPQQTFTAGSSSDYAWFTHTVAINGGNTAPNAPAPTSPIGGVKVDRSQPINLAATFNDPDAGDSPSSSKWRYRVVGATSWTEVTQPNPLQTYTVPAGLAEGDYEWQAAYADQFGAWGPYCSSAFFTATVPPAVSFLHPLSGETIGTDSYTGQISTASLEASEWTLYADDAGVISTTVLQGPDTVTTGDLRSHTFTGLVNDTPVWWSVRIQDGGLWSQPVTVRTPVSYTKPQDPTALAIEDRAEGCINVTVTNPAPAVGEPAVITNEVWRKSDTETPTRRAVVGPSGAWTDYAVASKVEYSYQAVAIAANGTTATSEWFQ